MSLEEYLQTIENPEYRARLREIFSWIEESFPALEYRTRWKQPMFTDHGTFIIGFSTAKDHLAVSPEPQGIEHFAREIAAAGYTQTANIFRIRWKQPVDYKLLRSIIEYNIADKLHCSGFWRK